MATLEPRGEQCVGTLNDLSGRIAGIPIRAVSRTVEWDPPSRCAFESVKPSWPISARIVETFEPSGTGTRHTIHYEVTPPADCSAAFQHSSCAASCDGADGNTKSGWTALAKHPDS